MEPVQLAVQFQEAASRSAQAFADYVVALDCARLYSPQQLFELKRLRLSGDTANWPPGGQFLMSLDSDTKPTRS